MRNDSNESRREKEGEGSLPEVKVYLPQRVLVQSQR